MSGFFLRFCKIIIIHCTFRKYLQPKNIFFRLFIMRTKIFSSAIIALVSLQLHAQTTRVLFIGNSYTATNNLPQVLYNLSLSLGDTIYHDNHTPGGYTFFLHSSNGTTTSKINAQDWDYVVLQAQSQEPSLPPAQVEMETYPYAQMLDHKIHMNNRCTKTMFYMTWGRKYGDNMYCSSYPPVCSFEGMGQRLRESYLEMGANHFAQVAPVGVAWKNARMADSTINLWSADNSHPSVAGTYLTACVFYASIFHESPVGATFTSGLSAGNAHFLQQIAAQTVLDSLDTWMLNQIPINANFSYMPNDMEIIFSSASYNVDQWMWDFGDGNTSSAIHPTHTYTTPGTYTVQLIASNNCYADTISMNITVPAFMGFENEDVSATSIYPNPATEILNITSIDEVLYWEITESSGKHIIEGRENYQINIENLNPGIYFLKVQLKSGRASFKFIKS